MTTNKTPSTGEVKTKKADSSIGSLVKLLSIAVVVALVVLAAFYFAPLEEFETDSFVDLPTSPAEVSNEKLQEELKQEMETLQSRFPDLPEALHVAAMSYAGLRQTKKAETLWRRCIEMAPDHVGPRLGLAIVLSERGNDREAVEILESALADDCVSPKLYHQLATVQTKLGNIEDAESTLQVAVNDDPEVPQNWLLLGQTKNQLQKFEEAEQCIRRAIALDYGTPSAYLAIANACQRQGKTEQAEAYREHFRKLKAEGEEVTRDLTFQEIYQQALKPLVLNNLTLAAAIYQKHEAPEKGEALNLRVLEIDPEYVKALKQLGAYYLGSQEIGNAILVHRRLKEVTPDDVTSRMNLASLYLEIGDAESAKQELIRIVEKWPELGAPYFFLAQIHAQLEELEQAREYAEKSVERDPTVQGYLILSAICRKMGDDQAATHAQEKAEQLAGRIAKPTTRTGTAP